MSLSSYYILRSRLKESLPDSCVQWLAKIKKESRQFVSKLSVLRSSESFGWIPAATFPVQPLRFPELTVGLVTDSFSYHGWSREFSTHFLSPGDSDISAILKNCNFILIEPTWNGLAGEWTGRFVEGSVPSQHLLRIVEAARHQQVPVIFWNKEDPTHFEDYVGVAALADYVFTTAEEVVTRYEEVLDHSNVGVLPFAVSMDLHNPAPTRRSIGCGLDLSLNPQKHRGSVRNRPISVAFAGTFFVDRLPERARVLQDLLRAGRDVSQSLPTFGTNRFAWGRPFVVWSRQNADAKYRFPEEFKGFLAPSLSYPKMLTAYRLVKVMLNVNTVVDSATMFSRRAIEALACGAAVVSGPSKAFSSLFSDEQLAVARDEATAKEWLSRYLADDDERTRFVHQAQRVLWRSHTYSHRVQTILQKTSLLNALDGAFSVREECRAQSGFNQRSGTSVPEAYVDPLISVLTCSRRPRLLDNVVENVSRQTWSNVELIYVAHEVNTDNSDTSENWGNTESPHVGEQQFIDKCREFGITRYQYLRLSSGVSLGEALNEAVSHARGQFAAKFDDDDFYGPHYLEDSFHALRFSRADLVGKKAIYVWLAKRGKMVLRNENGEHAWEDGVSGATFFAPLDLFREYQFGPVNRGEDSDLLNRLLADGKKIYSSDRFNFILNRHIRQHAWTVDEDEFMKQGRVVSDCFNPAIVEA